MDEDTVTAAQVAQRLGLGAAHADWLAALDAAEPPARTLPELDPEALQASLTRLGAAPDDAAEVLRTLPSPDREPETWWLLDRSRRWLSDALADRGNHAQPIPSLPAALGLFPAHLILVALDAIRGCHQHIGIPDDISWETLSFLGRALSDYRTRHGVSGVRITGWDWLRFCGVLYQVGRLEVTPYRLRVHPDAGPLFWYDDAMAERLGPGFRKGDPALGLHIPATGPLTPESCDASLQRLRTAFAGMYPGEPLRLVTCTAWLLDDQLTEYLPAGSNLLAFQRRFHLVPGALDHNKPILGAVCGTEHPTDLDVLPQYTTLQRAVVSHIRAGHHWRVRTGWLELGR